MDMAAVGGNTVVGHKNKDIEFKAQSQARVYGNLILGYVYDEKMSPWLLEVERQLRIPISYK